MNKQTKPYYVQIFRTQTAEELDHIFNFWRNGLEIELSHVNYTNCGEYHELCIVYYFKEER